jgi:hypothetical protein
VFHLRKPVGLGHFKILAVGLYAASVACALPASAGAAAPTPASTTNCAGSLVSDPLARGSDEPNLLDYSFHCDGDITAYSVTVNRRPTDYDNIDDFSTTADVTAG